MYVSFLLHVSFIFDCLVYFFLIFIILYYVYDFIINNKLPVFSRFCGSRIVTGISNSVTHSPVYDSKNAILLNPQGAPKVAPLQSLADNSLAVC